MMMKIWRQCYDITLVALALALSVNVSAEDSALGTVITVSSEVEVGDDITVEYQVPAAVLPDQVLMIYGPGAVEKHPLTKQVVKEKRSFVAKAQVLEVNRQLVRARIFHINTDQTVAEGFDAVLNLAEQSPNSPPVRMKPVDAITVQGGSLIDVRSLVADPEGSTVGYEWSIATIGGTHAPTEPNGYQGVLFRSLTGADHTRWLTPITGGDFVITVKATDQYGQQSIFTQSVTVTLNESFNARAAQLIPVARMGTDVIPGLDRAVMRQSGDLLVTTTGGRQVGIIDPSWTNYRSLDHKKLGIGTITAIAPYQQDMLLLDATNRQIVWLNPQHEITGSIGPLRSPTDAVVDSAGTIFVADQSEGGFLSTSNMALFVHDLAWWGVKGIPLRV